VIGENTFQLTFVHRLRPTLDQCPDLSLIIGHDLVHECAGMSQTKGFCRVGRGA